MKSIHFKERGQALILIALAMVGLAAIVGLAIDGSAVFSDQRHAQNAADTAAMAAAYAKVNTLKESESDPSISTTPTTCASDSMSGASDVCIELVLDGLDRAASNGYANSADVTVKVYSPPAIGYYQGDDDYVQVLITSTVKTTFMKVVGRSDFTHTVQAVTLAKPRFDLTDGAMIISYDPNPNCNAGVGVGGGSVDVSGSSTLNLNGGGMFINSSIACGYNAPNCPTINITGGAGVNSVAVSPMDNIVQQGLPSCVNPPAAEHFDQEPIVIPDEVYWPPVPPECDPSYPNQAPTPLGTDPIDLRGEWLIYPGYYTDFPQNGLVANKQHIYMASGVYCINLGHNLSWSPVDFVSLNGSTESDSSKRNYNKYHAYNPNGVTLYIRGSYGFTINSNNPTFLDATNDPNSDYQGYLIILEGKKSSIEDCSITGGSDVDINGLIFTPYCDITINGGSESYAEFNAQLIGWDIKINGNNIINFNYDPSNQVKIKAKVGLMK